MGGFFVGYASDEELAELVENLLEKLVERTEPATLEAGRRMALTASLRHYSQCVRRDPLLSFR